MQKHEANFGVPETGGEVHVRAGVTVTVTVKATGLPATLYSDNGITLITSAIVTDSLGYYGFYAPDGVYTLTYTGAGIVTFTREVLLEDPADNPSAAMLALGGDINLAAGNVVLTSGLSIANAVHMTGRGSTTTLTASAAFASNTDFITFTPTAGASVEKRNNQFDNFLLDNLGTAVKNWFTLDITGVGQYLNKFTIRNVIADAVTGWFVELVNPTNTDGLFCSVFEDNWSLNGYKYERVGDSVFNNRCTVSGAGVAHYVNQIGTASHIVIRDGNCTSAGGALRALKSANLRFENMQVEAPDVFTGSDSALVSFNSATAAESHQNPSVKQSSINTQDNTTLGCIYATYANGLTIDENTLFCYPATGSHITLGANARNVYIGGLNRYYNSQTGAETTPLITDNGVGTMGIWKDATLITTWTLVSASFGFPVGYFKSRDGVVQLRGNLAGAAPGVAMLVFTLPIGFRPKVKVVTIYKPYNGTTSCAFQIEANGNVTLLTTTATSIYFDGISFGTT